MSSGTGQGWLLWGPGSALGSSVFPPLLRLWRFPSASPSLVSLSRKEGVTCAQRPPPPGPTVRPCGGRAPGPQATHTGQQGSASVGHCPLPAARASACSRPVPDRALAGHEPVSGVAWHGPPWGCVQATRERRPPCPTRSSGAASWGRLQRARRARLASPVSPGTSG